MGILTRNDIDARDLNLSFEIDDNIGDLNKLSEVSTIRRSIETLLTTGVAEKPFREDYGSSLKETLFQVVSDYQLSMVESELRNIIENGEARIKLLDLSVQGDYVNHYLNVRLRYMLRKTSEIDQMQQKLVISE